MKTTRETSPEEDSFLFVFVSKLRGSLLGLVCWLAVRYLDNLTTDRVHAQVKKYPY